jgi:FkbM family methyltransferase
MIESDAAVRARAAAHSGWTSAGLDAETRDRFFDCTFVWSPRELPGEEPWIVLADDRSDPFFPTLLRGCRGERGFQGVVGDPRAAAAFQGVVFLEGPTWARCFQSLASPRRSEPRVVLFFEADPSGFWDFAKGCGASLPAIFQAGGLTPAEAPAIAGFLERWAGVRVSGGRFLPSSGYYTSDSRALVEANGTAITRVMAALADDESRATYARILHGTAEQVVSAFAARVFGPQQYMDIAQIAPGDVVINCGVGSGWELPYFLARLRGEGRLHNFDAYMDYRNTAYGEYVGLFSGMISDHFVLLSDRDGELRLPLGNFTMVSSGPEARARGQAEQLESYPCRSLDSLMAEGLAPRIDFLKMDVEGGEIFIFEGALASIRAHRPRIAMAIYHEPEQLWEYPLHVIETLDDYRFYIRQYGYSRFETLLYAVPREDEASGSGQERLLHGPASAAPARGAESMLLYFRDRPGAERQIYSAPERTLSRFEGSSWQTAAIRPAPQIQADEVLGVFERGDRSVIVTRHGHGPDSTHLVIGETNGGPGVDWLAQTGVGSTAVCTPVDSADGEVRWLVYEPALHAARLFRYADKSIAPERDISLNAAPLAAALSEAGVLTLDVLSPDRAQLGRRTFSDAGEAGEALAPLGGVAIGTALLERRVGGGVRRRRVALVQAPEEADAVWLVERRPDGSLARTRRLHWDPRFEPVAVVRSDAR